MLELNFLNTALIAGITASVTAGLLGSFMYAYRETVKSEMFAHVSLAGVGAVNACLEKSDEAFSQL